MPRRAGGADPSAGLRRRTGCAPAGHGRPRPAGDSRAGRRRPRAGLAGRGGRHHHPHHRLLRRRGARTPPTSGPSEWMPSSTARSMPGVRRLVLLPEEEAICARLPGEHLLAGRASSAPRRPSTRCGTRSSAAGWTSTTPSLDIDPDAGTFTARIAPARVDAAGGRRLRRQRSAADSWSPTGWSAPPPSSRSTDPPGLLGVHAGRSASPLAGRIQRGDRAIDNAR